MKRLITAAFTLSLLASPAVLAADYDYLSHGDNNRHESNDNNRYNRDNDRYHNGNYHRWHRGDRIGRSWFLYVPVNWRAHCFRHPAYGYQWIYADGLYLLVDRNGVVVEVST